MRKLLIIIGCFTLALTGLKAQTQEQLKICALKWTLQQAFYNKSEGQQIARLDVTEYESVSEFQKNKLIGTAISKLLDKTDQNRVNNILNAGAGTDISGYVPAGAKKEYQADVAKMKAKAPAATEQPAQGNEPAEENVTEPEPQQEPAPVANVQPVVSEDEPAADEDEDSDEGGEAVTEGMTFLSTALTCLGIYAILSLCLLLYIKSRRQAQREEEMVTMEQYRAERMKLMERIKALEIDLDGVKRIKMAAASHVATPEPKQKPASAPVAKPAPTPAPAPEPKAETAEKPADTNTQQTLFGEQAVAVGAKEPEAPVVPTRPKTSVVMFFPIPEDGVFKDGSSEIEPGRSLYMLKTNDGEHGTYQILNSGDAIAGALASLSEMVKPGCKIINTVASPVEILAEKPGEVVREGDNWRIVTKAVVRLI